MRRRRPSRPPAGRISAPTEGIELVVSKLGSEGVGVAYREGRPIVIAGALPDERVRISLPPGAGEAKLLAVLDASPDRKAPVCRHFGACGGCTLQHLATARYDDFKRHLITEALRRHGLARVEVTPVIVSPAGSRRRTVLEAGRRGDAVTLGFHGRASHARIDLQECPVLAPPLVALLGPLRDLLRLYLKSGERMTVHLALLDTGIDLGLVLPRVPDLAVSESLAAFADVQGLARVWWRVGNDAAVPAAIRRQALVSFGPVAVTAPMGGFLQATTQGQEALIRLVAEATAGARRIADLFAGCGTFSLPLAAAGASVHAVEMDPAGLAALGAAARVARLPGVTTEARDLETRPITADVLRRFDAVVFDPPRAGARAQSAEIAKADLGLAVAVSCNPATFARDAAILRAGGWRLERVTPVDQFLWSSHVELVGVFTRGS